MIVKESWSFKYAQMKETIALNDVKQVEQDSMNQEYIQHLQKTLGERNYALN